MLDGDIKTYHAAEVSANSTNGGRRSYTEVISGVINNVWPHVTKAQRLAGHTLFRFLYTLVADDDDGTLVAAEEYVDYPTDGDDYVIAFVMPYGSTQADITGTERKYGAADLDADVSAGAGPITFDVNVEDVALATGTDAIFVIGDKVRISDKVTPDAVAGNEEFGTLTAVSNVDTLVTLTISEDLANTYTVVAGTRVSAVMDYGDISTSVTSYTITTAGTGDYNHGSYPLILDNIGTVEDTLTFTWTAATSYTCVGSSGIEYGSGTNGVDFEPINPDNSKPYFKLEFAGFSGVWASGDTMVIPVVEASFLMCLKRVVPAACDSLANNKVTTATTGESDS